MEFIALGKQVFLMNEYSALSLGIKDIYNQKS